MISIFVVMISMSGGVLAPKKHFEIEQIQVTESYSNSGAVREFAF